MRHPEPHIPEPSPCDFTRKVVDFPTSRLPITGSMALATEYGGRFRATRRDEDYNVTSLGDWLTRAEVDRWIFDLTAEEALWNPRPCFGNIVAYSREAIEPPMKKGAQSAPGDLVIHRVIEQPEFCLSETYSYRDFWRIGRVVAVDGAGCVASFSDADGTLHVHGPQQPHIIAGEAIHAAAAMEFLALRLAEREPEYHPYVDIFSSPRDASRHIAAFVRPTGPTVLPSWPDRSIPDPRVARRFPPQRMFAAKDDRGQFNTVRLLRHDAERTGWPVVPIEVAEVDAPHTGQFWAWKRREGLVFIQPSPEAFNRMFSTAQLEIERGYAQIVPVAVTEVT